MIQFILVFLQTNVAEKIKSAPDNSYQIGVLIGSFLPFILLVGVAYWMYYRAKIKNKKK